MGNNASYNTVDVGDINIKMFDGVMRTLVNVRQVPSLKRNLISLVALNVVGCKFISQASLIKM